MSPVWGSGRVATVLSWMQWLEGHPSARHYAAVMAHGSLIYALLGRTGDAERWAEVAEQMPTGEALPDGSSSRARSRTCARTWPGKACRACVTTRGWPSRTLSPGSPFRPTMAHVEGVSHLLEGDLESADTVLSHACDLAIAFGSTPLVSLIMAERGVVAMERSDWAAADSFAQEALRHRRRRRLRRLLDQRTGPRRRPHGPPCTGETCRRRGSWSGAPYGYAPYSPTRSPWCRSRRWSASPTPVWGSWTMEGRQRPWTKRPESCDNAPTSAT